MRAKKGLDLLALITLPPYATVGASLPPPSLLAEVKWPQCFFQLTKFRGGAN